jgi:hypothetical protein
MYEGGHWCGSRHGWGNLWVSGEGGRLRARYLGEWRSGKPHVRHPPACLCTLSQAAAGSPLCFCEKFNTPVVMMKVLCANMHHGIDTSNMCIFLNRLV